MQCALTEATGVARSTHARPPETISAAVGGLADRGGAQECLIRRWSRRTFDPADFDPGDNIGIQFGSVSNGLCDVDLDCAEARALGPFILPATEAVFGRASSPASHWLYRSDLWYTKTAAIKFEDPIRTNAEGQEHGACLVELRVGRVDKNQNPVGAMSMVPPSLHPSGERVRWERDGEPVQVEGTQLKRCVATLAAAALLVRHYPAQGRRHDAALVLGGVLGARGLGRESDRVVHGGGGTDCSRRGVARRVNTAKGAVRAMQGGTDVAGFPRLREGPGGAHCRRPSRPGLAYSLRTPCLVSTNALANRSPSWRA